LLFASRDSGVIAASQKQTLITEAKKKRVMYRMF
jgi:hypothetical protein